MLALLALLVPVTSQSALPAKTPFLDKQRQLARFSFWDNRDWDWYKANIPFWESPDEQIDTTYYYRWELITKHRVYGSPTTGYTFTEFINRPGWSGRYGAISCPLGLQLYELRWLKDTRATLDYARYWYETPGAQPRSYSNWFGDGLWSIYEVTADQNWVVGMLPTMEKHYDGWMRERWRPEQQMFAWSGMRDGMETNLASRQTVDSFAGADSYRPTLNAYIYADLVAMAKTAALAGDTARSATYAKKAADLKERVQSQLWDPNRKFFSIRFANDEIRDGIPIKANTLLYEDGRYKGSPYGRQLFGYVPWMFNLPDKGKGYEVAWKGVVDPQVFLAPKGLYTVERRDPQFLLAPGTCVWSGDNWPYANAQTLQAMANVLNNYPQDTIDRNDYMKVFKVYSAQHVKDGKPYISENSDPNTGIWTFDEVNKSEHYFHSSFNDLLITGLAGLRPRADEVVEVNPLAPESWDYFALDDVAYHGHRVSVIWDRTGNRYKAGKGLSLFVDGKRAANRATLGRLTAKLPPTAMQPKPMGSARPTRTVVNVAVNNDSAYYPKIRASSTGSDSSPGNLYDGVSYYHAGRPVNRWVSEVAATPQHVELDFGTPRSIERVRLFLLDDGVGETVRAPKSIQLEMWDGGTWKVVPGQRFALKTPEGKRPNDIVFAPIQTSRLRAVLSPQPGAAVGMTEFEAWGANPVPLSQPMAPGNLALKAKATASFTSQFDRVEEINDGEIAMSGGRNRWTAFESPNPTDWVQLEFANPTRVSRVEVCFYDDRGGVQLPAAFEVQAWDGNAWKPVQVTSRSPKAITGNIPNEVAFAPLETTRIRVVVTHKGRSRTGISEVLAF